jgi:hypothetical protein
MAEDQVAAVLSKMLKDLPRVSIKEHFSHASFLVGKKVFAFMRNDGIAMKLPKEKIRELIETRNASPLVMGKRTMKEWVVIEHSDANAYKKDFDLFKEAIAFVSSKK